MVEVTGKFDDFERVEDAAKELARAIIWESFYIDGGAKEEEVEEHLKKFCDEKLNDVIENVHDSLMNYVLELEKKGE